MTAAALPSKAPKRSFREVWLITLGHALTHWYPATFYLILPLIGNELGLSYLQIGSILTTQAAAGAIANVPGGLLVDSVGRKGLLMALSLFWIGAPYLRTRTAPKGCSSGPNRMNGEARTARRSARGCRPWQARG